MEKLVVGDLFSCGGGMSAGFSGRVGWRLGFAVDLEVAKPSGKGAGDTGCNAVYRANHGINPHSEDLSKLDPTAFMDLTGIQPGTLACLISCAPCTDFSRANPGNHTEDRARNSLVGRSADFVEAMRPKTFLMENARELLSGNHPHHWAGLRSRLDGMGYDISATTHFLSMYGLPQVRERALVVASNAGAVRTLENLWEGWEVLPQTVTVRSALSRLQEWVARHPDGLDEAAFPGMTPVVASRLSATPHDGGSWRDVANNPEKRHLLTPECLHRWCEGNFGSHPDVYGRMAWDRPAPTIKRECAHIGNGRYAHPEADRLLTVREMATIQGFPFTYRFPTSAVSNRYRIIGDAVPPIISWQLAACIDWTLTGKKPTPEEWVMSDTTLRVDDLKRVKGGPVQVLAA